MCRCRWELRTSEPVCTCSPQARGSTAQAIRSRRMKCLLSSLYLTLCEREFIIAHVEGEPRGDLRGVPNLVNQGLQAVVAGQQELELFVRPAVLPINRLKPRASRASLCILLECIVSLHGCAPALPSLRNASSRMLPADCNT